jgi:hypothetical protein
MTRTIEGYKLPKPTVSWKKFREKNDMEEDENWDKMDFSILKEMLREANSSRKILSLKSFLECYIKVLKGRFSYMDDEEFKLLLGDLKKIYKRPGSTEEDKESKKEFLKSLKETYNRDDISSDDGAKGEGIRRGPGRPKKIVMKSYSSSSDEEDEKTGMGLKVKRGRPITVKGHKKCSCGSGLNVEPYKKFFTALKENTALK